MGRSSRSGENVNRKESRLERSLEKDDDVSVFIRNVCFGGSDSSVIDLIACVHLPSCRFDY